MNLDQVVSVYGRVAKLQTYLRKAKDALGHGSETQGGSTLRPIHQIARDIQRQWKNVNYAAKPYLDAMHSLSTTKDNYIQDSGHSVVAYFLGNANSFRGPEAKGLKSELKAHLKGSPGY